MHSEWDFSLPPEASRGIGKLHSTLLAGRSPGLRADCRPSQGAPTSSSPFQTSANITQQQQQQPAQSRATMSWEEDKVDELMRERSQLAIEVEQLTHELAKANEESERLRLENERLQQELLDRDVIQEKMREQLGFVTETASTLYTKFREFKIKYYKEQGFG